MDGLGLLIGHLIGDYIVQNDWMAANKINQHPGPKPKWTVEEEPSNVEKFREALEVRNGLMAEYPAKMRRWWIGHLVCCVHCLFYTLAVWSCSFWWMPWWGLLVCFAVHFPIDRWRLAKWWMVTVSGQKAFATGPLSPWSIIVVDNVFHLLTLFVIGRSA